MANGFIELHSLYYIQQIILTYITQLKMVDYNTFSKWDILKVSCAFFINRLVKSKV